MTDWTRVLKFKCFSADCDSYEALPDEALSRNRVNHQNQIPPVAPINATPATSSDQENSKKQGRKNEKLGSKNNSEPEAHPPGSGELGTNKLVNGTAAGPSRIQPAADNNQTSSSSSSNSKIRRFIGKRLRKSATRHLEKNISNRRNSRNGYPSTPTEDSAKAEARYTKFPVSTPDSDHPKGNIKSNSNQTKSTSNSGQDCLANIIPRASFDSSDLEYYSSDEDNCPRLNSVQSGDHTTIELPWTEFKPLNNFSSPNSLGLNGSHRNIVGTSCDSINSRHPAISSVTPTRRSRSLERNSNLRLDRNITSSSSRCLGSSSTSNNISPDCPPSPPPRPPSTLKNPNSRLVNRSNTFSNSAPELPPKNNIVSSKMNSQANMVRQVPLPSASSAENRVPQSVEFQTSSFTGGSNFNSLRPGVTGIVSVEDVRNSGFINKPSQGWLHSDQLLTREGVSYNVRYIGCLDVNTSMKSLDFDTRSLIAKECINQVCEAAGLKSVDRRRKIERRIIRILGLRPRLDHAGSDVCLTITSTSLKLTSLETGAIIAVHDMPNISFASGGDVTMLDFVAYVAKDSVIGRACFVLECGSGLAQDVITTVGQAFELRFKEFLQKRPNNGSQTPQPRVRADDPEYYNDLPGKVPPEVRADTKVGTSVNGKEKDAASSSAKLKSTPTLTLPTSDKVETSINLIDFEAPTPPAFGPQTQGKTMESLMLGGNLSPALPHTQSSKVLDSTTHTDPFDMQPFDSEITKNKPSLSLEEQRKILESEPWFHGVISRTEAEALLVNDGDFLVRESQTTAGQYVLTGLQNGSTKHLLLVDPEGIIRTKDQIFESVTHLIRHHSDSNRPIISVESMLLLRTPVPKEK